MIHIPLHVKALLPVLPLCAQSSLSLINARADQAAPGIGRAVELSVHHAAAPSLAVMGHLV